MPAYTRVGNTWRTVTGIYTRVGNTWRTVTNGFTRVGNTWRRFWPTTLTPYPIGPIVIRDYLNANVIDNVLYIANVGDTIYGARGAAATNWANDPTSFQYRWYWSTSEFGVYGPFSPVQEGTVNPAPLDTSGFINAWDGRWIQYQVRASNSFGFSPYFNSDNVARLVKYTPENLTNSITGTTTSGFTLTANSTWDNTLIYTNDQSPASFAYLWMYENGTPATNTNTNSTYVLDEDDVNQKLKVRITATNTGGSTEVTTALTATIAAGLGAFTINNVTKTDGTAKDMTSLTDLTITTSTKKIEYSYVGGAGATLYRSKVYGTAFDPDSTSASPSLQGWFTVTSNSGNYDDTSGTVTAEVSAANKPIVSVSWGASTGASAYRVFYNFDGFPVTSDLITSGTSLDIDAFNLGGVLFGVATVEITGVTAYQNANGTGLTRNGTMPTTTSQTPTVTFGTALSKSTTITAPFVTPTFTGNYPTWNSNNFQRTTQLTSTTGRRLAGNQAFVYHSGNNFFGIGASVTIAGLPTAFNGTFTINDTGSDGNGSYIRYARTNANIAYASNTTGTISATSGIRWGWNNGTVSWNGDIKLTNYGWYWQVGTAATSAAAGNWGSGFRQFSTTDQSTLVNGTGYRYVIFSNQAETGVVFGSTAARFGRIRPFAEGTDDQIYYADTYTGFI
jgi:hypothetical protein